MSTVLDTPVSVTPFEERQFRRRFDWAVYDAVLSRNYGINLQDLYREVRERVGACCECTIRRALALLRKLGYVAYDSAEELYYGVWDSRWTLTEPRDDSEAIAEGVAPLPENDPDDWQPRVWKPDQRKTYRYQPSQREITAGCEEIQAGWDEERQGRQDAGPYEFPMVSRKWYRSCDWKPQ